MTTTNPRLLAATVLQRAVIDREVTHCETALHDEATPKESRAYYTAQLELLGRMTKMLARVIEKENAS